MRSRWAPKPEQIMILESIFNNGTVNPPRDETARIRKLLQKFGPVGDANVFYWFQNRRSRSRRKQRLIQAATLGGGGDQPLPQPLGAGGGIPYHENLQLAPSGFEPNSFYPNNTGMCLGLGLGSGLGSGSGSGSGSSSSSLGLDGNDGTNNSDAFFSFAGHQGLVQEYEQNPIFCSTDASTTTLPYQSAGAGAGAGVITVFINGVATEVVSGGLGIKGMFGEDFMMFHSSGIPVQVDEYGFLVQGLQHGESYFLVPRQS